MIAGAVSGNAEAIIRLTLRAATGATQEIDAIIDTGFTGDLTLPPALVRRLNLSWTGRERHCRTVPEKLIERIGLPQRSRRIERLVGFSAAP